MEKNLREMRYFLDLAHDLGIKRIDTAPSYGYSELNFGKYKNLDKNFEISTKIGREGSTYLTPKDIRNSVETSLKNLKVSRIQTLYIHSTDFNFINDDILTTMLSFISEGKVLKIGYSGDNENLNIMAGLEIIESLMSTLNLVDLNNLKILRLNKSKNIAIKRPLANFVWAEPFRVRVNRKRMKIIGKGINEDSYYNRFLGMYGKPGIVPQSNKFIRMSLSFFAYLDFIDNYCIGTSNAAHIKKIRDIEADLKPISSNEFELIVDRFNGYPGSDLKAFL